MKTRRFQEFRLWLLTAVCVILFSANAFAADYTIVNAVWAEPDENGRCVATWEKKDDSSKSSTKYRIRLYRGTTSKPVGDWILVSGTQYEFSRQILNKGTGKYFFEVYPSKGGEDMKVTSDIMEVDSVQKRKLKDYFAALPGIMEENFQKGYAQNGSKLPEGWQQYNGNWYYRQADGTLKKSCWLQDKGKWYYLSSNGQMLTGWQAINSKWYCFDSSGALYVSTTTPDGSTVNENGEWVENGVVVTDDRKKSSKQDPATVTVLSEFEVGLNEKVGTEGEVYLVSMKNTSAAKMIGESYSIPQEQWVAGQPVTITVTYETYAGYAFSDTTVFTCSKAAVIGNQPGEDATVRTLTLKYVPNLKLKTPDNFYMDSDYVLRWDSVPHAPKYEVRILNGDTTEAKKSVESPIFRLEEYMSIDSLNIKITAVPTGTQKAYITKSATVLLEEVSSREGQEKLLVPGKIIRNSDGSMQYKDENGNLVKNQWVKLAGNWYHFNASGLAENQGWYLDTTGHWYYFDEKHRMLTGSVTVDGKKYNLNDGSRADLPVGARY